MYEFLEHPSEELIRVTGKTVAEVFVDAATALFELMTDTGKLKPEISFEIQLIAPDRPLLLIDWLNRLILIHETEHVFFHIFEVVIHENENCSLTATIRGQKISDRHERRLHAKSATYGQLRWTETPNGHQVEFVVDI